ncbi:hypothetical protein Mnod_8792 (plasmid) [Methylobacterium nodulans ORS 2060]|uniref:Uncharacterized protein n=1 Tax=Methylobacterium nodulans (strain LMG 21967 / CNCM I-2342 / ORS 2060) TaxID=460265 RepID=B8IXW2_METNO|nr:hypothetical protein Mnod_8792 [Methylobacterium nodulans ORS 2060]
MAFVSERQAHATCKTMNAKAGRERFKLVKRGLSPRNHCGPPRDCSATQNGFPRRRPRAVSSPRPVCLYLR